MRDLAPKSRCGRVYLGPFKPQWNVPILGKLPAKLRPALEGQIRLFLDQVDFHGGDGFEVTERMQLAIPAQGADGACIS